MFRAGLLRTVQLVALLCVATLGAPSPSSASHAELAGQWHLDTGAAVTTTPDSSGHDFTMSTASVFETSGRFDKGFELTTSSSVRTPAAAALEPSAVSVVAWVNRDGSPGNNTYLVSKGGDGCNASSYALRSGSAGGIDFYIWDGSAISISPEADAATVWDDRWHAVAATYDGAAVRLYVDGEQVGNGTPSSLKIKYALSPTNDLALGGYANQEACFPGGAGFRYTGKLDEVRVYNRALSPAEVAQLAAAAAAGPAPPQLDSDGDGAPNSSDNCRDVSNPGQPDADSDGIGDACDPTPSGPPPPPPPPSDGDQDGVADAIDNCPSASNADQADADGDGIGSACDPAESALLPGSCANPAPADRVVTGTPAGDRLVGTPGRDTLNGLAGNDCLFGRGDSDTLNGGPGADVLLGEGGDDTLDGDGGNDRGSGQSGDDRMRGGSGNDRLAGGSGDDVVSGHSGNDSLTGASGNDRLQGDAGNDRINGGSGRDLIEADSGNDAISARDRARDRIRCGSGRDTVSADAVDKIHRDCERVRRTPRGR